MVLILGIVRIKKVATDLLISLNSPVSTSVFGDDIHQLEAGKLDPNTTLGLKTATGENVVKELLKNLEIRDWHLFG